jgi:hypothetical protein
VNRARLLHAAEIIDSFRVVPRILIFTMLVWVILVTDKVLNWYMHLSVEAQSIQASGLAASIVATVTGLWTVVFKTYSATGRDWNQQPMSSVSTTTSTSLTGQPQ